MWVTDTTRTEVRQAVAADLTTLLTEASEVVRYQRVDFGAWPFVRVFGDGSQRGVDGYDSIGCVATQFLLTIQVWVLMASKTNNLWQEEQAEDVLDAIEQKIAVWLTGVHVGRPWDELRYRERSRVDVYETKAEMYLVEEIPIVATLR